ncbi:MAG: UDP-glucose/GDP-mannose dehydrogenase family protein [Planctomycetes bacterium]|nr:UDP-glucose/GDP-mannose dehydrogenase family protein [Planctomycetota bacterium]
MKVAVIGSGYVGLCTGACLSEIGHDVICVDNNEEKVRKLIAGIMPIYEPGLDDFIARNMKAKRLTFSTEVAPAVQQSEVIFICVGTPSTASGKADLSYVEAVARTIASNLGGYKLIVEKSTVPVNTAEKIRMTISHYAPEGSEFDVASNPEFLAEGTAMSDAMNPSRIVLGVTSKRAENLLRELYKPLPGPVIVTDTSSSELIKHASNSFLAMKISFVNALANICELAGADVSQVTEGMGLDPRIGPHFLRAGVGYGGSCFPKDVDAFHFIAEELGYNFRLLAEVQDVNREQVKRFIAKIDRALWVIKEKKIAVLGVAFKPDTDDIRNAPSIAVIEHLLLEGAQVRLYDPKALENAKQQFQNQVSYHEDIYDACTDADCTLLLTEWKEVRTMDLQKLKSVVRLPLIIDGRNLFDPKEMKQQGFKYFGIGRRS